MTEDLRSLSQHVRGKLRSAPRAVRARPVQTPLPVATAEQVKTLFYAPVLAGTNLAEGLLRAAKTDAGQIKTTEWQSTMQQAMEQIRASCAALDAILSSESSHEAFPAILSSVDELDRFLRLVTPLVGNMESEAQPHQVDLSSQALAQAVSALRHIYKTILHPTSPKRPAAIKHPHAHTPRRSSAAFAKPVHRPG